MATPRVKAVVEDFRKRPHPLRLRCGVQHYQWGGFDYIPDLLGIQNRDRKPYAELWIGAHPDLPSVASVEGVDVPLNALIDGASEAVIGRDVASRFDRQLPFLLKILSAGQPLSIQAHPTTRQAEEGFVRENELGIPLEASHRNYHDPHHKPELISALTDFFALRGFRPLEQIGEVLDSVPEFQELAARYRPTRESLVELYTHLMRMGQTDVDGILSPLVLRLRREHERRAFNKEQPEYWVLRADSVFSSPEHRDRGLFSVFLLNLVHLVPGQAMYLPAGELHAYLEGTGVEIMANSNNVLRGGLTPKHVDVDELLRVLTFSTGEAQVLEARQEDSDAVQAVYETPAKEFVLSRLRVIREHSHDSGADHGVHIAIVVEGRALLSTATGEQFNVKRGESFLIPQGLAYRISSDSQVMIFKASVPHV